MYWVMNPNPKARGHVRTMDPRIGGSIFYNLTVDTEHGLMARGSVCKWLEG